MPPGSVHTQGCAAHAAQGGCEHPRRKIVDLPRTLSFFVFVSVYVFNVWPETPLPPVWPGDPQGWAPLRG